MGHVSPEKRAAAKNSRHNRGKYAQKRGLRAEFLCRWWLRLKGYKIIAANWRCRQGEIDIIARKGQVLAFIEVKARCDEGQALGALTRHARHRLARAAAVFLATHRGVSHTASRFDVMVLTPGHRPVHIIDAWRLS